MSGFAKKEGDGAGYRPVLTDKKLPDDAKARYLLELFFKGIEAAE
jgi:hypothetical protein